jgi:hypothetical protein
MVGDLVEDRLVDVAIGVDLAAGEEQEADRPAVGDQQAGKAGAAAFLHHQRRQRERLRLQVGFEIVEDAWLTGREDLLQAAARHRP